MARFSRSIEVFLAFLERDMAENPQRLGRLSETRIEEAVRLIEDVRVDDQEELPDDMLS